MRQVSVKFVFKRERERKKRAPRVQMYLCFVQVRMCGRISTLTPRSSSRSTWSSILRWVTLEVEHGHIWQLPQDTGQGFLGGGGWDVRVEWRWGGGWLCVVYVWSCISVGWMWVWVDCVQTTEMGPSSSVWLTDIFTRQMVMHTSVCVCVCVSLSFFLFAAFNFLLNIFKEWSILKLDFFFFAKLKHALYIFVFWFPACPGEVRANLWPTFFLVLYSKGIELSPFCHPSQSVLTCLQNCIKNSPLYNTTSDFRLCLLPFAPSPLPITFLLCVHACVCRRGVQGI